LAGASGACYHVEAASASSMKGINTKMEKWSDKAACKGSDPGDYFDNFYKMSKPEKISLISRCERCPVVEACYAYALENKCEGIWGGKEFLKGKPYNALRKHRGRELLLDELQIA